MQTTITGDCTGLEHSVDIVADAAQRLVEAGLFGDDVLRHHTLDDDARLVQDHLDGRVEASSRIWSLLMLELWHREVVEQPVLQA